MNASVKLKFTHYFLATRHRLDRVGIREEWIEQVFFRPESEFLQEDGRVRRWARIADAENCYLRVVVLPDGETIHNAFFDRSFKP